MMILWVDTAWHNETHGEVGLDGDQIYGHSHDDCNQSVPISASHYTDCATEVWIKSVSKWRNIWHKSEQNEKLLSYKIPWSSLAYLGMQQIVLCDYLCDGDSFSD